MNDFEENIEEQKSILEEKGKHLEKEVVIYLKKNL